MKRLTKIFLLSTFVSALLVPVAHAASASHDSTTARHRREERAEKMVKVDINSAAKEELMEVKGIDDATADKIIAGRPYMTKAQLKSRSIVDAKTYNMIAAHIVAKRAKGSGSSHKKY